MRSAAVVLGAWDLVAASLLVVLAGGISLALRLGLERRLFVASFRTVTQLLFIGLVLRWVFAASTPLAMTPVVLVMLGAASRAAVERPSRSYPGAAWWTFAILTLTGFLLTAVATRGILGIQPWWSPQYLIPLMGMVLGNSLTGISLTLDDLLTNLVERRHEVELSLSLGASRWEAARPFLVGAVRRGMIPILNSMTVVGLVSLPGMMTGQILAGADPLEAVNYQILIMFLLCGATSLGSMLVALVSFRRLFNSRHQLVVGGIHSKPEEK
jgi:putative ABC transport system permease protein